MVRRFAGHSGARRLTLLVLLPCVACLVLLSGRTLRGGGLSYTLPGEGANRRLREKLTPPEQSGLSVGLEFLKPAFKQVDLAQHADAALTWCEDQGAVDIAEVLEALNEMGEELGLESWDTNRLGNSLLETMKAEQEKREAIAKNSREMLAAMGRDFLKGTVNQKDVEQAFKAASSMQGK
mmetsp:Transcript_148355/g.476393  ORF Transcript_148355/g.476393 Transcript_148355/m.476393 type:complete len:180 (+) Transcript_148355:118-657(+)